MHNNIFDEGLDEELSAAEQERDIFFNIINRYIGFYTREAHRATKNDTSCEYPFVAMDTRQVFEQISFVKDVLTGNKTPVLPEGKQFSFMDVGCGTGNILLIAEQFGFDVWGIEKDEYPFSIAQRLIGEEKIFQEDIRNYKKYAEMDVIYYFCPFSAGDEQRKFEQYIENEMKAGAVLIANQKKSDELENDGRFMRLHNHYQIWQKMTD